MDENPSCPACGHHLSMFETPEPGRGERVAGFFADHVASWWFPTGVLVAVSSWVIVNVTAQPFDPYPTVMYAVISAVLATIAACQGPLILLAQRRSAMRDRARDVEVLHVTRNNEADLHRLEEKLDAIIGAVTTSREM